MGVSILIGSFIGGFGSTHMPESGINLVYGILDLLIFATSVNIWNYFP